MSNGMNQVAPISNWTRFHEALTAQYVELFKLPQYALAAGRHTPEALAELITDGLASYSVRGCGSPADKNGQAVQAVIRQLGIKNTYKAIAEYLR